nr:retrovirus-related Pol polyprotein from transposon TNT 1-94 [Tanacetum cinerariifolium]
QKVERLQAQLRDLKGKSSDIPSASNTLDPLNQKLESKIVELEFQVVNYERKISHLKTTYKNLFDSITSNRENAKLHNLIYENAKLRARLFKNTFESMNNTSWTSVTPHIDKPKLIVVPPHSKKLHASIPSHSVPQPKEFNVVKYRNVIAPGMFKIDPSQASRGNITITRVYFVEGLGHNLFSVGQFCDANLEVAFRRNTCFVRDLDGVDLLKGNRSINLYTINLYDMASTSPICLMARATPTKSWLWHQRLSHLNFNTSNDLAKNDLVSGLPKFKYAKEHLFPSCEQGESKRASHPPKLVLNSKQRLHLLHMDLCGPMRVASINGKWYVLVVVDDYSRYTWVHILRTKDETPKVIHNFLKKIYVHLQAPVIIVRTDKGTEFKNYALKEYFDSVGITHETSAAKTPQQNGVVERRNRTLVEAARTMLIFSHGSLFLWAEAIATACYTQNHSIIHRRFNKTPYELIQGRKSDISYFHSVNQRKKKIMETMNITFDELLAMAFEQNCSRPGLQSLTSGQISSELELTYAPSTITPQRLSEHDLDILFEPLHNEYLSVRPSEAPRTIPAALVYVDDIIVGSSNPGYATLFSDLMKSRFEMSMIGEMTFFLGLQVNQSPSGIFINQSNYVNKILKKYRSNTCNIIGTPMDIKDKLDLDQIRTPVDATKYHSMIGALMYLTSSRSNVVHATCDSGFELTVFSNADYAGCKGAFKSTSSEA